MALDPAWLTRAIALSTGRAIPADQAAARARALDTHTEVFPWLTLRAAAFADEPAITAALQAQAARTTRPRTARHSTLHSPTALAEANRLADEAIRQIVAENVDRARLGEEVNGLLARANEAGAGLPGYDFARHIGRVPPAEDE